MTLTSKCNHNLINISQPSLNIVQPLWCKSSQLIKVMIVLKWGLDNKPRNSNLSIWCSPQWWLHLLKIGIKPRLCQIVVKVIHLINSNSNHLHLLNKNPYKISNSKMKKHKSRKSIYRVSRMKSRRKRKRNEEKKKREFGKSVKNYKRIWTTILLDVEELELLLETIQGILSLKESL